MIINLMMLGAFVYSTLSHIKYCLPNGDQGIVRCLTQPVYILKYVPILFLMGYYFFFLRIHTSSFFPFAISSADALINWIDCIIGASDQ